jgi:hypothetical protein
MKLQTIKDIAVLEMACRLYDPDYFSRLKAIAEKAYAVEFRQTPSDDIEGFAHTINFRLEPKNVDVVLAMFEDDEYNEEAEMLKRLACDKK